MQRVVRSTIIDAPIERVWAVLRDFNSHTQWHEAIDASRIEGSDRSDQVGCVRSFTLKDGNRIREQLLHLSDAEYKSSYCIVDSTVPLQRYVAHITCKRVTDSNRTFWHWESTFSTPQGMERQLADLVAHGVYETGFRSLRRYLQTGGGTGGSALQRPTGVALPSRRVSQGRYGDATVLTAENAECPAPGEGEVRIQQRAIGVNYLDIYLRKGWLPQMLPLPGVLGMEAAGSVIDFGPHVSGLLPGDRVAYLAPQPGAYCSVRNVPASCVVRLPAAVEDTTAAAMLLKGITADYLLRDLGHVGPGTRLLVHSAAGGVGLIVCEWAKRLGAIVIGTVSTEEKARLAREHGCEHVIVTRDYRFAQAVQRICGGADVLIDGIGQAARDENLAALARRGHWISLGHVSGAVDLPPGVLADKSLTYSSPLVFDYVSTQSDLQDRAQRVWDALGNGTLKPATVERYTLDAAHRAHERLESRDTVGSLILVT